MPTTKYRISEQVLLQLKGGNPKIASSVELEDIIEYAGQVINKLFKQEQLSVNLPSGETVPSGLMLGVYDNIVPVAYKGVSKITLPAVPISLPRNMGVFHVSRTADINNGFIPMQSGQMALIGGENLINSILGVTYEIVGKDLIFSKDLTTEAGVTILLHLVIMDINSYDDYTPLPLPADMEAMVVDECFKKFATLIPQNNIDDPSAENSQQQK